MKWQKVVQDHVMHLWLERELEGLKRALERDTKGNVFARAGDSYWNARAHQDGAWANHKRPHEDPAFAIPGRAREDRAFAGHRRGSGDRAFAGYDSYDGARSDQAHYKPRNMQHDVENEETKDSIKSLSITLPTLAPHTGREEWAGGWRVVIG